MFTEAARVRILAETGWKGWVASEAGPGVTPNFITLALKSGELKPPASLVESKRKRR